jgi:thiamine kinase-like enzyme
MNKITKLLDKDYVIDFLREKILPLYPDFKEIKKVKIIYHKNHVWQTTYHVVLEFKTLFSYFPEDQRKTKKKTLSFFCTAHSNEPRENVYNTLRYLWGHNFSKGFLSIPKPLFYSEYFRASFYRGVKGDNLLFFIKNKDDFNTERLVRRAAEWLVKLHKTPISDFSSFDKNNNKIKTVVPGYEHVLRSVKERYGDDYCAEIKRVFDRLISKEKTFLDLNPKRYLVHGDVHPENIIKIGREKMAMIDFADICKADFARDLGSFLQQLDYRVIRYNYSEDYVDKLKNIFLETYCRKARISLDSNLKERIDLYYNWAAFRTVIFWLLKHEPSIERAEPLLLEIKNKIK